MCAPLDELCLDPPEHWSLLDLRAGVGNQQLAATHRRVSDIIAEASRSRCLLAIVKYECRAVAGASTTQARLMDVCTNAVISGADNIRGGLWAIGGQEFARRASPWTPPTPWLLQARRHRHGHRQHVQGSTLPSSDLHGPGCCCQLSRQNSRARLSTTFSPLICESRPASSGTRPISRHAHGRSLEPPYGRPARH